MSGGISFIGTLASIIGSLLSTTCFFIFSLFSESSLPYPHFLTIFLIGIIASFIDSLLGSVLQGKYLTIHNEFTEQKKNNQLIKGYSWVTNDLVNFSTTIVSSLLAVLITK